MPRMYNPRRAEQGDPRRGHVDGSHRETLIGLAQAERERLGRMIQFAEPGVLGEAERLRPAGGTGT